MTVILVIMAWALGTFDDELPKGAARAAGLFIHVSAGLLILVALITRLAWRVSDPPPPPQPNEFGRWLGAFADPAARLAHYTLYALLIAVPLTGIVAQFMATRCRCSESLKFHHLGRAIASSRIR